MSIRHGHGVAAAVVIAMLMSLAGCDQPPAPPAPATSSAAPAPPPAPLPPPAPPADPKELDVGAQFNFGTGSASAAFLKTGWSTQEAGGTWSNAKEVTVELPLAEAVRGKTLTIEFGVIPYVHPPTITSQKVTVMVGGVSAGVMTFDATMAPQQVTVPATATAVPALVLALKIPGATQPKAAGFDEETRTLGTFLRSIKLVEAK